MGRFPKLITLLGCMWLCAGVTRAQDAATLKYFGLSIHPFGDPTAELQPYKLDPNAFFVLNFGGFAGYEHYVWHDLASVKVLQGVFTDCSGGLSGFSHIGVRGLLASTERHRLMFGIGPALMYRESWARFGEKYTSTGYFNDYHSRNLGEIQWKLYPAVFEFEYDYRLGEKTDFSFSFTPGIPTVMTMQFGVKYWFNKNFKPMPVNLVRPGKRWRNKNSQI